MARAERSLLSAEDRNTIVNALSQECSGDTAERFLMLLYIDQGLKYEQICRTLNISADKLLYWRKRYANGGLQALSKSGDRPREADSASATLIQRVVEKTKRERPENGQCWSTRSMARAIGVSDSTIRRIWRDCGIDPQRMEFGYECFTVGEEREKVSQLVAK